MNNGVQYQRDTMIKSCVVRRRPSGRAPPSVFGCPLRLIPCRRRCNLFPTTGDLPPAWPGSLRSCHCSPAVSIWPTPTASQLRADYWLSTDVFVVARRGNPTNTS